MDRMTRRWHVATLAVLAACARDTAADGAGTGPYAARVAEAVPRIEQTTGLAFKRPPVLEQRSRAEVRAFLEREFREKISEREMRGTQIAYNLLGAIPDSLDLRALLIELLNEQVVGYYDPSTDVLYVVKGARDDQVGTIIWHELVHALQDQYVDLDSLQEIEGDNDRQMAVQAVMEGHATLQQMGAMLGPGVDFDTVIRMSGGWDRIREAIQEQSSGMPVFSTAPVIIQQSLIFPYLSGAEFARRYGARQKGKFPMGTELPRSTEQIMHEDAYFGATPDVPTSITLPAPRNATEVYQNNLGEFETRVVLFQQLQNQNEAVSAAAGWDGDRYMVVTTPKGDGLVWLTVWDSTVDAAEFGNAISNATSKRFAVKAREDGATRRFSAGGRAISVWGGEVAGRPAVLYVDVPEGASSDILDLGKVQLSQ